MGCLFQYIAAALVLLHLRSWFPHDQCSSMELGQTSGHLETWDKQPVFSVSTWAKFLGRSSRSGRKPRWTNCCQNLSFKDILFSRALLRLCLIRIKFQWGLDCVVEEDEAFSAKLKTKNTKGTCYWGKNFFLLESSSLEIWKILSKCKSDANVSEYRSKTGRQWVSFASFAGGHPQR